MAELQRIRDKKRESKLSSTVSETKELWPFLLPSQAFAKGGLLGLERWQQNVGAAGKHLACYATVLALRKAESQSEGAHKDLSFPNGTIIDAGPGQIQETPFWFPTWVSGAQRLGPSCVGLPGTLAGSRTGSRAAGTPTNIHLVVSIAKCQSNT